MILEKGNIIKIIPHTNMLCFTANSTLTARRTLVMGAGFAYTVKYRFPKIDLAIGRKIISLAKHPGKTFTEYWYHAEYGVVDVTWFDRMSGRMVVVSPFQVKYYYGDMARIDLIGRSLDSLMLFVEQNKLADNPNFRVDLNYPGIGFGGLSHQVVRPFLERAPDWLHVWTP